MRSLNHSTAGKLFLTGFTIGPIVDSLHNQCLLRYDILPISMEWPRHDQIERLFPDSVLLDTVITHQYPYLLCSSWTVPPLLGIAYVVLGGILPRVFETLFELVSSPGSGVDISQSSKDVDVSKLDNNWSVIDILRNKALLAVTSTALIIKLSEYLETHPTTILGDQSTGVLVLLMAALIQWALLDGTIVALVAAITTSIGGPLSELPFVAHGVWEYLDTAADYFPLQNVPPGNHILELILNPNYSDLALSKITGPCYFAVAMDAIALGRWFDATSVVIADTTTAREE
jgi:hypothetical protein